MFVCAWILEVDVLIIVLVIANCPIGYTQHGNSCYVINRVQASWAQASVSTFRPTSSLLRYAESKLSSVNRVENEVDTHRLDDAVRLLI